MPKRKADLKILLLQNRLDAFVREDEHRTFVHHSGLRKDQIDILNTFDTPGFETNIIDEYDALFVGGASEVSVSEPEKHPFVFRCQDLMRYSAEKDIPVFASCFGFQLAVLAFGGEIIKDTVNFERGTIPIRLTEQAASDPVCGGLPDSFLAVSVHQEKADTLPEGFELLAVTDLCCHAFRISGKRFWGFQFHPEIDHKTLVDWLRIYHKKYSTGEESFESIIAEYHETPDANRLIRNFVDKVLLS